MSLDRFKSAFTCTGRSEPSDQLLAEGPAIPDFPFVISELGGRTFNGGLYRVLRGDQLAAAREAMESVFPEYRGRIVPFAFDWLGRHFASDLARVEEGEPQVLMLEVGAGEAMVIPASILDFHNIELVEYADDVLAAPFWEAWRTGNPEELAFADCVGYKVPLFLGGSDDVPNLEVTDLDIYVTICGQLRNRSNGLPAGESVRAVGGISPA